MLIALQPKPLISNINDDVLIQLGSLGYDLAKARKSLKSDPTSPALTAYHILLEKYQRVQNISNINPSDAATVSSPTEYPIIYHVVVSSLRPDDVFIA